jgi:hypothetical protein
MLREDDSCAFYRYKVTWLDYIVGMEPVHAVGTTTISPKPQLERLDRRE